MYQITLMAAVQVRVFSSEYLIPAYTINVPNYNDIRVSFSQTKANYCIRCPILAHHQNASDGTIIE